MDVVAECHNDKLTTVLKVVCFKTTVNFLSYLKHTISMHVSVLRQKCNDQLYL